MRSKKFSLVIAVLVLVTMACLCTGTGAIPTAVPQPTENQTNGSGIITEVVMAQGTQGDLKDPVDLTTVFSPSSVIHAVVKTNDAPANTKFSASFYVVDVGDAASPDTLILTTDVVSDGTRNIDFALTPTSSWPPGSYRVEISVNDQVDQVVTYTVQ